MYSQYVSEVVGMSEARFGFVIDFCKITITKKWAKRPTRYDLPLETQAKQPKEARFARVI